MRIAIDLQGAQTFTRFRDIGRYAVSLAEAMARNAGPHEIWLVLNSNFSEGIQSVREKFEGLIPQERIRVFDVPYSPRPDTWEKSASEIIREAFLDSLDADVVLVSSLFEGFDDTAVTSIGAIKVRHRTAVIVYDLIPHLFPDHQPQEDAFRRYYNAKLNSLRRADALLSISESLRSECIQHLHFPPGRITNISSSIESDFGKLRIDTNEERALIEKLAINRKILLYAPGGADQRKNFDRLIEAYAMLEPDLRSQHQLVITSRLIESIRLKLGRARKHLRLGEQDVVFTDYISNEALMTLYSRAELFVFPSLHEGLTLPLLEAMACGAPVIGSNLSSIPEVIDNPQALFDPYSVDSISSKMCEALKNERFRTELRSHSYARSAEFSWNRSARRTLEALENLTKSPPSTTFSNIPNYSLVQELADISHKKPSRKEALRAARSIAFNSGSDGSRQLLLDVSTIANSDSGTGIQRVVRGLLNELLSRNSVDLTVKPIYFDGKKFLYANCFMRGLKPDWPLVKDDAIDLYQDDIYLSLDLNMHLPNMYPLHQHMRLLGVKVKFIVYDLLLTKHPEWWPPPIPDMFNDWLEHICQVADHLICISNDVAKNMGQWIRQSGIEYKSNMPVINSFKLGADIAGSVPTSGTPADAQRVLARIAARPSFLMVGTIEPRKGYAQALSAFESLWREGLDVNLIIVGKVGWLVDDLAQELENHPEKDKRLTWLRDASDEYLKALYTTSTCLLAASEGEGFGLPLVEAALHGLPIIARDLPVFLEVAEEAAYYFEGKTAASLAMTIKRWLELCSRAEHPQPHLLRWYTWAESADSLIRCVTSPVSQQ